MPKILAVGTAIPPYPIRQEEAKQFARKMFADSFSQVDRYLQIFENTSIRCRYLSKPRTWYEQGHPFVEKNKAYFETAIELGEQAVRRCLNKTGMAPEEIDHFVFVSTTGFSTPSIDAYLINRLSMKRDVKRTPVWGLGCAGGVAGLARACEYARANPSEKVLLLAVECCSLTFCSSDRSKSNLVATSLFADGAAAVLIGGENVALPDKNRIFPKMIHTQSYLWPDSEDVMGWEFTSEGMKVIFSRSIPDLVHADVMPAVQYFLAKTGTDLSQIEVFITHPGGKKVLDAYHQALHIPPDCLALSYQVLRDYGNMSSATILFVLERELEKCHAAGSYGLMSALGPGFSLELALLRWDKEEK
ncbi:type III polyketide synthase [Thermoactinomyces mirandus]|uniref:Type III polyketide synthase n=1 Tax=Thermoactinomyces mirandus TaxID=2756294 RepID=A0A7W2AS80_9BACL|nr:3-oxoacyl-[acyl-carrier-protein] synthase III C-terminal domain-containing protein [Thermoactinomyces mirandus]MBA4603784.1 type III polyketide synthase [Thermoactinomyces mirandus]